MLELRSVGPELLAQGARDVPLKTVATALGTSETAARSYLNDYLHP
ncbi:hypothetical protein AB0G95_36845 [Streptomyces virginiae]